MSVENMSLNRPVWRCLDDPTRMTDWSEIIFFLEVPLVAGGVFDDKIWSEDEVKRTQRGVAVGMLCPFAIGNRSYREVNLAGADADAAIMSYMLAFARKLGETLGPVDIFVGHGFLGGVFL
jgi:hypothetical protein